MTQHTKPGSSRHLTFAINPLFSNFIGNFFTMQIDISVHNYSYFVLEKEINFSLNQWFCLHKLTTMAFTDKHNFGLVWPRSINNISNESKQHAHMLHMLHHIYYYYTLFQNTEFLLDDKRVLVLNETPLSICRSTILRYC